MDELRKIDELLEKKCCIIDFLPERVPGNGKGQFFDVEYYFLNSEKHGLIKDKFVGVILKLMCYFHIKILWNGWVDRPEPARIEAAISEIMENHSGTLHCLFPNENMLLIFDWDCLNLSVYNLPQKAERLFKDIALSEGLFMRASAWE